MPSLILDEQCVWGTGIASDTITCIKTLKPVAFFSDKGNSPSTNKDCAALVSSNILSHYHHLLTQSPLGWTTILPTANVFLSHSETVTRASGSYSQAPNIEIWCDLCICNRITQFILLRSPNWQESDVWWLILLPTLLLVVGRETSAALSFTAHKLSSSCFLWANV